MLLFLLCFTISSTPTLIADYQDASGGDHSDTRRHHHHHEQRQEQQQRTRYGDRVESTDPAEARDKHDPSSHLQQPRRLTLADHPTYPASVGTHETSTEDVSLERQAAQRGSSWLEELRAHSATTSTSSPRAEQGAETPSIPALGTASGNHLAGNQLASRRLGESLEGRGGLGASKSVLVLNGAACFVGGRLASTGESQVNIENAVYVVENRSGSTFCFSCLLQQWPTCTTK